MVKLTFSSTTLIIYLMLSIKNLPSFKKLKYKQVLLMFSAIFLTACSTLAAIFFLFQTNLKKEKLIPTEQSGNYFDQQKILKSARFQNQKIGKAQNFLIYDSGSGAVAYITDEKFSKKTSVQIPLNSVNYEDTHFSSFANKIYDPLIFLGSSGPYSETTLEVLLANGTVISKDFLVDIAANLKIDKSKISSFHLAGWTDDNKFKISVFTDAGESEFLTDPFIHKILKVTTNTKSIYDLENVSFGATFKFPDRWEEEVKANGEGNKILNLIFKNSGNKVSTILNPGDRGYEGSTVENVIVAGIKTKKFVFKTNGQFSEIYIGNFCNPSGLKNCYGIHFEAADDFKNNSESITVFNEIVSSFKFVEDN